MRTKLLSILLVITMLLAIATPTAAAAGKTPLEMAREMYALGLVKGAGTLEDGSPDFDLDSPATREAAATMLIRLMGKEAKAAAQQKAGIFQCPFGDVSGWAQANVTWLYMNNYVNGTGATTYAGGNTVTAQEFATLALRSLGYLESEGDFKYAEALDFAVRKGILDASLRAEYERKFVREGMIVMCYNALNTRMKYSSLTLKEKLTNDGVFKTRHTELSGAASLKLTQKYKGGGNYNPWAIELFRSCSPVAADINQDGKMELLVSGLSLYCLDAASGKVLWQVNTGKDRSTSWEAWASSQYTDVTLKVKDLDGDGKLEIINVTASDSGGVIAVYDQNGYFKPGWPKTVNRAPRALHIMDFDNDAGFEICVGLGTASSSVPSFYVYEPDGSIRPGWPLCCGWGTYSDSMNSLDMDGDGKEELVFLFDDQFVAAYKGDASPVIATGGMYSGLRWRGIPVCETIAYERKCVNWANAHGGIAFASGDHVLGSTREERFCIVGTYSGISVDDLDGDGKQELACTGLMVDGSKLMRDQGDTYEGISQYYTAFILNTDRTRYTNAAKGFDWTQMPTDTGRIITYKTQPQNIPVTADVDGDGNKEIIYSSADGMVHCWNLDGTEHGAWPYNLDPRGSTAVTLATKPAVADVNGDGKPEIIFGTYFENVQLQQKGQLIIMDGSGKVLARADIPPIWGSGSDSETYGSNFCTAQPCVADIDGDGKPEIAVTTKTCGVVAYEIG